MHGRCGNDATNYYQGRMFYMSILLIIQHTNTYNLAILMEAVCKQTVCRIAAVLYIQVSEHRHPEKLNLIPWTPPPHPSVYDLHVYAKTKGLCFVINIALSKCCCLFILINVNHFFCKHDVKKKVAKGYGFRNKFILKCKVLKLCGLLYFSLKMAEKQTEKDGQCVLPLSRIRTIMKSSPDVGSISHEALFLTGKATVIYVKFGQIAVQFIQMQQSAAEAQGIVTNCLSSYYIQYQCTM